jgi:UDP-glucose 4-epimerase
MSEYLLILGDAAGWRNLYAHCETGIWYPASLSPLVGCRAYLNRLKSPPLRRCHQQGMAPPASGRYKLYLNPPYGKTVTRPRMKATKGHSLETVLVTGSAGFFGGILKRRLLASGYRCVGIDLVPDNDQHPNLVSVRGDLRDAALVDELFRTHRFYAVQHCAAMLAHGLKVNERDVWTGSVDTTRNLLEACEKHDVRRFVFTSTNCLWASNLGHPIAEDELPRPVEVYGRAKLAAEEIIQQYSGRLHAVIIRCPTIIDMGRLGLLAILFEFIDDGKTVWLVGKGGNHYQFIYAEDLASACMLAMDLGRSDLFHIGSDRVATLREVFEEVIRAASSKSTVRSLPRRPAIAAMKLAHLLQVSPLGPYHYKMIAEDFLFDTRKIKRELNWQPTLTNSEMLVRAYAHYSQHRAEIEKRSDVSAHSKPAEMGIIRLLKWIS